MKRWNGWGNEDSEFATTLSEGTRQMLEMLVGPATPSSSVELDQLIAQVPPSRLPTHTLINTDAEARVRHARGQSLPDLLAIRSGNPGAYPDGVALPTSSQDVADLMAFAAQHNFTVIPYGGGTSVAGHINPETGEQAVLTVDMGGMNQLLELDRDSQLATFGAGAAGPGIEAQLNEQGYTLGHFPQSWELSTVGGWVASRSSGQQSLRYGRIEQIFAGGRIETFAGALDIPTIPASSAGPDIREMILGSEGRMGIITEVKVRVTPLAEKESFHVMFFPSWSDGVAAAKQLVQQKVQLSMVRLSNPIETMSLLHMGGESEDVAALEAILAEQGAGEQKVMMTYGVTGSAEQYLASSQLAAKYCSQHGGVDGPDALGEKWAHGRFSAPYLRDPMLDVGYAVDTMETAVDWTRVSASVDSIETAIRGALADEGEQVHAYTHLSHVYGQGSSIYTTYLFRCCGSYEKTLQRWAILKAAGAEAIVACGGTISHQHGVGGDHREYLPAEKGELGIAAIRSLCTFFDPNGQMNPGKLLPDAKE
ncbi:MAG: FAD-binding oxidoreductase [Halioglobus sp.]